MKSVLNKPANKNFGTKTKLKKARRLENCNEDINLAVKEKRQVYKRLSTKTRRRSLRQTQN